MASCAKTHETWLAAAEEPKKAANQEKLEREESACEAHAKQEAFMEKVVQASMRLQEVLNYFILLNTHVIVYDLSVSSYFLQ